MTIAAPLHIAGTRLLLDPLGALYWPDRGLLAVADLHLEKGSAAASQGRLVPPWDTRVTLDRLASLLRRYRPRVLVALGDSFHDAGGASRMLRADAERLAAIATSVRTIWVMGNHDPAPPQGLPGETVAAHEDGPPV
jgi:metallophosphoesterase superfamily enzyme